MIVKKFEDIIEYLNKDNLIPFNDEYLERGGDGFFGNTVENFFGLKENNFSKSDFEEFELKSKKFDSNSKITLFTKGTKDHFFVKKQYILDKCKTGYVDVGSKSNIHNLKIRLVGNFLEMIDQSSDNTLIYKISLDELRNVTFDKIKNILYLKHDKLNKFFTIKEAIYYRRFSFDNFVHLLENNKIFVCFNIGSHDHDRGTQFRILSRDIELLYEKKEIYSWY